jgi:hypothetical protein
VYRKVTWSDQTATSLRVCVDEGHDTAADAAFDVDCSDWKQLSRSN